VEVCFCSGEIRRYRSANPDPHVPSGLAGVKPVVDVRNGLVEKYSAIFGSGIECLSGLVVVRQLGRTGKNLVEEPEGVQFGLLMATP